MSEPDKPSASPGVSFDYSSETRLAGLVHRLGTTLEMIKFKHSIFALPFALLAALMAADGLPSGAQIFWIVLACVFARSAAMSFNRLMDEDFDRLNPRSRGWALPSGRLTRAFVWKFLAVSLVGFILCSAALNSLALWLSPVAVAVLLGYSLAKRRIWWTHFILGAALGIAPVGAWVAVRAELGALPVVLGIGVMLWTAGFDIIYSLQDVAVDKRLGLHSIPVRFGVRRALAISAACHALCLVFFLAFGLLSGLGMFYLTGLALCAWLLRYEHKVIGPDDLSRLDAAFFTINGWISVVLLVGGAIDLFRAG